MEWACILRHNEVSMQSGEEHAARQTGGKRMGAT